MCRWLMYHGDKIKMSDLLVDPEKLFDTSEYSLITRSGAS